LNIHEGFFLLVLHKFLFEIFYDQVFLSNFFFIFSNQTKRNSEFIIFLHRLLTIFIKFLHKLWNLPICISQLTRILVHQRRVHKRLPLHKLLTFFQHIIITRLIFTFKNPVKSKTSESLWLQDRESVSRDSAYRVVNQMLILGQKQGDLDMKLAYMGVLTRKGNKRLIFWVFCRLDIYAGQKRYTPRGDDFVIRLGSDSNASF